jgi:hypothetical protein
MARASLGEISGILALISASRSSLALIQVSKLIR